MAIFTKLQRLHQPFAWLPKWPFITLDSLMLVLLVPFVGAYHSMVHRISVSHSGFVPGLLCGEGVKWSVWHLCRCSLVGTGKTEKRVYSHYIEILKNNTLWCYYSTYLSKYEQLVSHLSNLFTRSPSQPLVMVIRFPRPGTDACWQPHSAWLGWPSLHSLL